MKRCTALLCILLEIFFACANPVTEQKTTLTIVDQTGRVVELSEQPERIVSSYYISSSACIALGLKDNLVAVEAQANQRPVYMLAAPELIDLANVGTSKSFSLESCLAVNPDLVILPKKQKEIAEVLEELGIPAVVVNPESHEEIIEMFDLLGKITHHEKESEKLIEKYNNILTLVREKTRNISNKPVVYICGTGSYLTTAPKGMYQSDLIELAGGINAGSAIEGGSRVEVSYEQLISFNPDIIIVPTNSTANDTPGFTVEDILNDPVLADINAVKTERVFQMPVGLEAWDSPVPSGALGVLWMLNTIHPELCTEDELKNTVNDFYKDLYGFDAQF